MGRGAPPGKHGRWQPLYAALCSGPQPACSNIRRHTYTRDTIYIYIYRALSRHRTCAEGALGLGCAGTSGQSETLKHWTASLPQCARTRWSTKQQCLRHFTDMSSHVVPEVKLLSLPHRPKEEFHPPLPHADMRLRLWLGKSEPDSRSVYPRAALWLHARNYGRAYPNPWRHNRASAKNKLF